MKIFFYLGMVNQAGQIQCLMIMKGRWLIAVLGTYLLVSKIINEKCSDIDLVLCSSAKRTIETLNLCMQHINVNRQTEILDELYLSSSEKYFEDIK